jgi:two-component system chemotaxis response regulator CheB
MIMSKIRVLIVDDSVVIRRMLREVLSSDPNIEVAGVAANGAIALSMIDQVSPDLVTMDIEMPVMDGLETLSKIREKHRSLPVVMFSTLTLRGAEATIEALSRGASDYVTKPREAGSYTGAVQQIRSQLLSKIKALCRPPVFDIPRGSPHQAFRHRAAMPRDPLIRAVVVGASTGGPNALATLLPRFPEEFPVPIMIVQHMPPIFTRFLAERLTASSHLVVMEASLGQELAAGRAWVAPGDYHMTVARAGGRVQLNVNQGAPENSCRPSVDVLFRSAAETYGPALLAVVMTGMGQDGLVGCEHIKRNGGRVIAQDEATSVVWGMPGFVAKAGLADMVLPLDEIGPEVVRTVNSQRATAKSLAR